MSVDTKNAGSAFQSDATKPPVFRDGKRRHLKPGESVVLWSSRVVIWAIIIVAIVPILFVITASFNPSNSYFSSSLIPANFSFANYAALFQQGFWHWMFNSFFVGAIVAIVQVGFTLMGAFAFSRQHFFGRKWGLLGLIILQYFPNFLAIAAIYAALAQFGMINDLGSYMLVMLGGSAYNMWLMKGYMDTVPRDLDEAARIDGAGVWQRFTRIILPLVVPMMVVIFLFNFTGAFNEYIMGSTILQTPNNYTLGVGLYGLIQGQFAKSWGPFAAGAVLAGVPLVLLYGLSQRYIASGLVSGATKG